ncbi:MAG: YicC family protein [Candidatus Omnitrophica bacterium]|nr:YicC family protein [Candidatus Omnitrophota bacterium]MDE2009544.1 YicC family protein [Candidatus Omnitrophota bacterium]MDE2214588.1 YicC family protein [Candidatus Omnitrophota bacterium]MDE2231665.1 YicC family protein [Candidatus Omnitrophota bacterium]
MITGMTGFGAGEISFGKVRGIIEVKTVNHRYLDVAFYLPAGFSSLEDKIQKNIVKSIKRGRVTVSVKITEKPHTEITLNQQAVKRYLDFAGALSQKHRLRNDIAVADIMRLPGVVEAREVFVQPAEIWPVLERALQKAVAEVAAMRRREGRALGTDISGLLKRMTLQIGLIKKRINDLLKESKDKMTPEEFSSYQKGNDIHEELARLDHYIDEAKTLLRQTEGAGKKLDFIAQEMQREANTVGSKVQDKIVGASVIAIKAKVEKIREQSNNVE